MNEDIEQKHKIVDEKTSKIVSILNENYPEYALPILIEILYINIAYGNSKKERKKVLDDISSAFKFIDDFLDTKQNDQ